MSNSSVRPGPAKAAVCAVIFDWAGTVIDFGCMAPVVAFQAAFTEIGFEIAEAEARAPMGVAKREHISLILAIPAVEQRWRAHFGTAPTEDAIDDLYARFLRIDAQTALAYTQLIPGACETIAALRAQGAGIGSTTGYPREIIERIAPLAAGQGYAPDNCITVSDAARGRPWPDMVELSARQLGVQDAGACVVVDDSGSGLQAARNAKMWAVGVSASGNEIGLSLEAWTALDPKERARRLAVATERLHDAGAHFVIESIADLPEVVATIEARLGRGERP